MDRGRILLEVFGDARVNPLLEREPGLERGIYERATDLLAELHRSPPGNVPAYEAAVLHREAGLLTEWYAPALGVAVDAAAFATPRQEALGTVLARPAPRPVPGMRTVHADHLL